MQSYVCTISVLSCTQQVLIRQTSRQISFVFYIIILSGDACCLDYKLASNAFSVFFVNNVPPDPTPPLTAAHVLSSALPRICQAHPDHVDVLRQRSGQPVRVQNPDSEIRTPICGLQVSASVLHDYSSYLSLVAFFRNIQALFESFMYA